MIWSIIIGVVVLGVVISYISLSKDVIDMQRQSFAEKFELIVNVLNDYAFGGRGKGYPVDENYGFQLHDEESNQIIQFHYLTGNLTIHWDYECFQQKFAHKKVFRNVRNLSMPEQQSIANTMIREMEQAISNNEDNVLFGDNDTMLFVKNVMLKTVEEAYGKDCCMTPCHSGMVINWDKVRRMYQHFEMTRKLLKQSPEQHVHWIKMPNINNRLLSTNRTNVKKLKNEILF